MTKVKRNILLLNVLWYLFILKYIKADNSLTSTQSKVIPWDLWIENAHANLKIKFYKV